MVRKRTSVDDMPTPDVVARLLDHIRHGSCDQTDAVLQVDPASFSDEGTAQREREGVFGRVPFIAAHGSEIAEPGDFLLARLPNNEAILVRQPDGSVRSFVNVCRHRGSRLETRERGSVRLFSCMYHGWSYGCDGRLRNITYSDSFGPVDEVATGLVQLPTVERYGFVWVVDAPGAPLDLDAWLGEEIVATLTDMDLGSLVCSRAGAFDEPINWKVMQDAFLDGYHIKFAHPTSAGPHIHTNHIVFEDFGRHVRFFAPRKSIDQFLEADPTGVSMMPHVTMTHFLAPNATLLRQPDHYQLLTFLPHHVEAGRSRMEMRLLVRPQAESGDTEQEWTRKTDRNWDILMEVLRDEDFPLLRDAQQALENGGAGPLSYGRNEVANQVFHRSLAEALG